MAVQRPDPARPVRSPRSGWRSSVDAENEGEVKGVGAVGQGLFELAVDAESLHGRGEVAGGCQVRRFSGRGQRTARWSPCRRPHLLAAAQRPHLTKRILCHTYGQRRVGCAVGDCRCACRYSDESAFEKVKVCGGCLWGG